MLTFADVLRIAASIGPVEESKSYGTPALKVCGKLLARLREDGDSLVLGTTFEEREELMAADPETYYITDHYLKYPWVLVRLSKVHPDALRDLLGRAWRLAAASKKTSKPSSKRRPRAGR